MTFGRPVGEAEAVRLVHWANDHGVNFIDTADVYEGYDRFMGSPGGVAEAILGKALTGRRDRVVITTKVGSPVGGDAYKGSGLSRRHILRQINGSLQRMRTDYVDFYELHHPDPATPLAESIAVMADLIAAGKVRHWGFSNFDASQVREMVTLCDANGWPRPVISQPSCNWLRRQAEAEHLPVCREYRIGVTPYRPLEGGLLTGKYKRGQAPPADSRAAENPDWWPAPDDAVYDRLEGFERQARASGLRPSQYAVKWLLDQPGVCSVVVGVKRIGQLEELLGL
jgi:aryl-alcohol dehydrogenase-like predicted oxidoreductase